MGCTVLGIIKLLKLDKKENIVLGSNCHITQIIITYQCLFWSLDLSLECFHLPVLPLHQLVYYSDALHWQKLHTWYILPFITIILHFFLKKKIHPPYPTKKNPQTYLYIKLNKIKWVTLGKIIWNFIFFVTFIKKITLSTEVWNCTYYPNLFMNHQFGG